ncbi:hypothetical protein B0T20DRAFT_396844 [Sordaria brevicollis]|uniref:Uncharacterized protein n=1 Tax=Sordaria brevicollis TaxID=83679 RepID=A0AAE0P166_SORBR|nr:hypothetical protein B0T20DRAFT_396844 [Sordaria brevicollis]
MASPTPLLPSHMRSTTSNVNDDQDSVSSSSIPKTVLRTTVYYFRAILRFIFILDGGGERVTWGIWEGSPAHLDEGREACDCDRCEEWKRRRDERRARAKAEDELPCEYHDDEDLTAEAGSGTGLGRRASCHW